MEMRTGLVWHEQFMWHQQGKYAGILPAEFPLQPGTHHESAETKRRLKNLLDVTGMSEHLLPIKPRLASVEELATVHTQKYLDKLATLSDALGGQAGFDAPFTNGSFDIARLAAGGCLEAVDAIMSGKVKNAYCLVRPIGHHAEPDRGMGFCLLSNTGLVGKQILDKHKLSRIAFIDLDVHHGNGVEKIFWNDPRALTISIHQEKWFPPDTGDVGANGEGAGAGYNINIPLPAGSGWGAYENAFSRVVLPALERFKPEFIVIPAGYDAGAQDPLGRMILSSNHYRLMVQALLGVAERYANGRVVVTHEGGYNESTVPFFGMAVIEELAGRSSGIKDPHVDIFDSMTGGELLSHQEEAVTRAVPLVNRIAISRP